MPVPGVFICNFCPKVANCTSNADRRCAPCSACTGGRVASGGCTGNKVKERTNGTREMVTKFCCVLASLHVQDTVCVEDSACLVEVSLTPGQTGDSG